MRECHAAPQQESCSCFHVSAQEVLVCGYDAVKELGNSPYKSHGGGPGARDNVPQEYVDDLWMRLQQTMWKYVGVVRTDAGLELGMELMQDIEREAELLYKRKNTKALASTNFELFLLLYFQDFAMVS